MSESYIWVKCGGCASVLDEPSDLEQGQREPCPVCESVKRDFSILLIDRITLRSSLKVKAIGTERKGRHKAYMELQQGASLHRDTGKWNELVRVIDRRNNWYKEVITDPVTGEVIRKCEEPLSEHTERGSAERKKPRNT